MQDPATPTASPPKKVSKLTVIYLVAVTIALVLAFLGQTTDRGIQVLGEVPFAFVLFLLVLMGVAFFHHHTLWVALAGVFVIKGFDSRVSALYLLIGIISAICSGMAYNLVRRLREREEPIVVVLHFQLVGVAAGLVFICFNWRTPLPWEWFCLLMCGVLTQVGQICLTKSLQAERIAKVAVLNYIGLVYALIFGVTIFGERYSAQAVLGNPEAIPL